MVLVSAMNPTNKHHKTGMMYLKELRTSESIRVPTSTLIEFDLVMRNNGYTESEILDTLNAFASFIEERLAEPTISVHAIASGMRTKGLRKCMPP
jgi:hypothetical protein